MRSNFKTALTYTLTHEGGKVDDPRDPGGRTNQGVTQKVFQAYLRNRGETVRDVFTMTSTERDDIYRIQYWDKIQGDSLPAGVDYAVFDAAVNSGPAQAARWLQRAVGSTADGVIGERTLAAVSGSQDTRAVIRSVCDQRLSMMERLPTWKTFGRGWTRRVDEVRRVALELAGGQRPTPSSRVAEAHSKALVKDASPAPPRAAGDILVGAGSVLASTGPVAAAINSATESLRPLVVTVPSIGYIVAALTVLGVLLTAAGYIYRTWAASRSREIAQDLGLESPETIV